MKLTEIPMPEVRPGRVLIKVKAFGINHSEVLLRQFEVGRPYINKPIVPGIECVGEVIDPSDSCFRKGQRVMALMGGMGRSFNGSYAEYALLPSRIIFAMESNLDWDELAAKITDMMNLIERGNIHPVIARIFTLEQIAEAHLLAERRGQMGKIVVVV